MGRKCGDFTDVKARGNPFGRARKHRSGMVLATPKSADSGREQNLALLPSAAQTRNAPATKLWQKPAFSDKLVRSFQGSQFLKTTSGIPGGIFCSAINVAPTLPMDRDSVPFAAQNLTRRLLPLRP